MIDLYQEIVALAQRGHPPSKIAPWMNISKSTVNYNLRKARLAGEDIPRFTTAHHAEPMPHSPEAPKAPVTDGTHISVPNRLKSLLDREAERRGKTASEVARDILEQGLLARASRHD